MTALGARRLDTGGRLAVEWTRLRTRPDCLTAARRWGLVDEPLSDLEQVMHAVGFEQPRSAGCEERLRRLVTLAATDELAARVVIQRILPGLLAVVRRRRGMSDHVFEELLGAAWIAVRTFTPTRRPRSIAASLISDADYAAFRAAGRRRSGDELPTDFANVDRAHVERPSPCDELAEILSAAVEAGLDERDVALVRMLLAAPTANQLAEVLEITPRTIRNRRRRITSKLREVALAA